MKRVHSKLATLYHPLLVNDTAKLKPKLVDETYPTSGEAATNINSKSDTDYAPKEPSSDVILLSENSVSYPDTRIKIQLDSSHKQFVDRNYGT